MQLYTLGYVVTEEFQVCHRWRTTTLFSGGYALTAEHVHARSLQKLNLFDWHSRLGLLFACMCPSMYSVQRSAKRSRIKLFFILVQTGVWQRWRTWYFTVTAFIAKRPGVAYSCSYIILVKLRRNNKAIQKAKQQENREIPGGTTYLIYKECDALTENPVAT